MDLRKPVVFRCGRCPSDHVYLRAADSRGRLQVLRRAAEALALQGAQNHKRVRGHEPQLIEVQRCVTTEQ